MCKFTSRLNALPTHALPERPPNRLEKLISYWLCWRDSPHRWYGSPYHTIREKPSKRQQVAFHDTLPAGQGRCAIPRRVAHADHTGARTGARWGAPEKNQSPLNYLKGLANGAWSPTREPDRS